jgi:hypothetical protein
LLLGRWRLIVAKHDTGAEVGGSSWSSPVPSGGSVARCSNGGTALGKHLRKEQLDLEGEVVEDAGLEVEASRGATTVGEGERKHR